jgi:hypothetical protein
MKTQVKKEISSERKQELLNILESRFKNNMHRHSDLNWNDIAVKLESDNQKLWILDQMEMTGGEPDVIKFDKKSNEFIFYDCSSESPSGRRSVCYDKEALESRKKFKPATSAIEMATAIGIELLTEAQYRELQQLGDFDTKTSSWLKTPEPIRILGGAIFGDFRFSQVFIYHNGAESYYSARGFRGSLRV